ncbi:hypothetical protein DPMN_073652 [Dreissena polymorpha]|uniref:Uncharacterized protein n=1 Tax=Dreissena polymorpha TaxID=45954 RepID=A0A9D4BZK7_DREPO|nr:hypothetical protein DPMN_073652 [Dreissena polymorpha]
MDNWQIGYSDLMEFTQIVMDQVHLWQQSTKYCILLRKECSSNNNNIVNIIQISRGVLLTEASKTGIGQYRRAVPKFQYGLHGFRNKHHDFPNSYHDFRKGHHDFIRHHDLRKRTPGHPERAS